MAEATKKGSKMLVDSIDRINVTSVSLEGKRIEIQDKLVEKQLEYFKVRNEVANRTQMAMGIGMIEALNNLTHVMTQTFTQTIASDNPHTNNANVIANNDTQTNNNNAKNIIVSKAINE